MNAERAAIRCIQAAALTAIVGTVYFWGLWWAVILIWVFAYPLALLYGLLYGIIEAAFRRDLPSDADIDALLYDEDDDDRISFGRYAGIDLDEAHAELEEISTDPYFWLETEIDGLIFSDEIVGKYKDTIIHEWVMMSNPETDSPLKCHYKTVIDMSRQFDPPEEWFVLLEPGILYVADPDPEINSDDDHSEV